MIFAFIFLALTVPGFVLAVRALPWVEAKVLAGVKPWACDVCSCFWSTVLWALVAWAIFGLEGLVAAPPSYVASLAVLGYLSRPSIPPSFPEPPT
jgi:hypothetical protein